MDSRAAALRRIAATVGDDVLDQLATRLPGADLRTLLLEVARRRAAAVTPPGLLRQRTRDRLTATTGVDARRLHELSARMLLALPRDVEVVELSPVVPLGTHGAVATVAQDKVVTTVRGVEVAADPTNALAVEAALRRRDDRVGAPPLRLAAVQRVLRAQPFDDPDSSQHFTLLGAVAAVRGTREARTQTVRLVADLVAVLRTVAAADTTVLVTDLDDASVPWRSLVAEQVGDEVAVRSHPTRRHGRGYYRDVALSIVVTVDGRPMEIGDGGIVDWTGRMLADRHERLVVLGLGLDRLVTRSDRAAHDV